MGSGKTIAAINYMNQEKDKKFIYITPYLSEVERIQKGCADRNFVAPSNKEDGCDGKKINHIAKLISEGNNIVTTHSSFENFSDEMLDNIKQKEYYLIIDEAINAFDVCYYDNFDLNMAIKCKCFNINEDGRLCKGDEKYEGSSLKELYSKIDLKQYEWYCEQSDDGKYHIIECYWALPPQFINSFKDVILLTYLFEGQPIWGLFKLKKMEYKYIGINKDIDGEIKFTDNKKEYYIPEYIYSLKDKIKIYEPYVKNNKMVGRADYSLSESWFKKRSKGNKGIVELRKALNTYLKQGYLDGDVHLLWSTFKSAFDKITINGYKKNYTVFNLRATNEYIYKNYLAYVVNLYINVGIKNMLYRNGIELNDDKYALSTMLQWIWRSAIRVGEPITIYIPSKRMRDLLINWMDSFNKNRTLE